MSYVNESGEIKKWDIPFKQLEQKAEKGDLEEFYNSRGKKTKSFITQKEDISLSLMLQSSLFMFTEADDRIKNNISKEEYNKLYAISSAINHLDKSFRRPSDYPENPRVSLVAGHIAGRGITVQNPFIDFVCTSFCFTDTKDTAQRGATNTQRFGRACGMLNGVYNRKNNLPIVIATEGVMRDSVANEVALQEMAAHIEDGELVSLKDLITEEEWVNVMKRTKKDLKEVVMPKGYIEDTSEKIDGVSLSALRRYIKSNLLVGRMINFLYSQNNKISFDAFKQGILYCENNEKFMNNIDGGRGKNCQYGKLWSFENNEIQINPQIKKYINTIL